jgi:hypothetical protein
MVQVFFYLVVGNKHRAASGKSFQLFQVDDLETLKRNTSMVWMTATVAFIHWCCSNI